MIWTIENARPATIENLGFFKQSGLIYMLKGILLSLVVILALPTDDI